MNILKNYRTQNYRRKELIIVINKDSMDLRQYRKMTRAYPNVSVYKVPEKKSLGRTLNYGISKTRLALVAKFDDDDYYSPYYLSEQVKALLRTRSEVVGKHACLVHLASTGKLVIRSPKEKNKFVRFVQGGTLLFRRAVFKKVRFADRSVGEDVRFLRDCGKKGFRVYATSPYNYVYVRRKNKKSHTWTAKDRYYLAGSKHVAVTKYYQTIATRKK